MSAPRFVPLQQSAFTGMENSPFLKGFLRVMGNKQVLEQLAKDCEGMRDHLISLARTNILRQLRTYPFSLLPVQLAQQTTGSGTAFLRWRKVDRSSSGVDLWEELLLNPTTPFHIVDDLYQAELQRIVLNMQISLLHSIAKQSRECAVKVARADFVLQKRLNLENSK